MNICPESSGIKYFQKEFIHGETEMNKICLNDCPTNYPYYTIMPDLLGNLYGCQAGCEGYVVPNEDTLINAKLCLDSCPEGDYKYKIESLRHCYKDCPTEAKFHFSVSSPPSATDDNNCYVKCPDEAPYFKKDTTICLKISEISGGSILYDTKEWYPSLTRCPSEYKLYSLEEDFFPLNPVRICLIAQCEYEQGTNKYFYETPYKTCVKDCSSSATSILVQGKNMINDVEHNKCVCENLFHIDETTHEVVCYYDSVGATCKDKASLYHYPLALNGTNQCLKICNNYRVLNPSEDLCYGRNTPCSSIGQNTKLIQLRIDQYKCECAYIFYYNDDGQKICRAEFDICTEDKKLFIPETKECVATCPTTDYTFKFKNFCLDHCPRGSTILPNECDCGNKFWYEVSVGNYECLTGDCLDESIINVMKHASKLQQG